MLRLFFSWRFLACGVSLVGWACWVITMHRLRTQWGFLCYRETCGPCLLVALRTLPCVQCSGNQHLLILLSQGPLCILEKLVRASFTLLSLVNSLLSLVVDALFVLVALDF